MPRETIRECLRKLGQASTQLVHQEGQSLNEEQRNSALTIHNGIQRLKFALQDAERCARGGGRNGARGARTKGKAPAIQDWNHALLSPLTAVRGFSKLLLDGAFGRLSIRQRRLVDTIHRTTHPLLEQIGPLYLQQDTPARQPIGEINESEMNGAW